MRKRALLIALFVLLIVVIQPACTKFIKPTSVLLFDESINGFAEAALNNLSIAYTKVTDYGAIVSVLQSVAWDLIVFDNPNQGIENAYTLLYDYVTRGGRLVMSTWKLNTTHPLWGALGYVYSQSLSNKTDVFRLNKLSSLWKDPYTATDLYFASSEDNYYGTNAQPGSVTGTGKLFATFEEGETTAGAVFIANSGRTILNAFLLDDGALMPEGVPIYPVDYNTNGTPDSVEWWTNEIKYVCSTPGKKIQPTILSVLSTEESLEKNSK